MDEIETIARSMALFARYPEVQLAQTAVRKRIVDAWGIRPGARVLEIGCGQGDLTAVLAHAVGPEGHVTACDLAAPDYGAPISIGEATGHLRRSWLGSRITFQLRWDVLAGANTFPDDSFDYAVLAHCSWYFDSIDRLRQTLIRIRPWAPCLGLSEWDLVPQQTSQLAHLLSVVIQGQVEAFREVSSSNIRTPLTRDILEGLVGDAGWGEIAVTPIDSSDLQDGQWEVDECASSTVRSAIEAGLPRRLVDLLRTEVSLLQEAADTHGKRSLSSLAILAKRV